MDSQPAQFLLACHLQSFLQAQDALQKCFDLSATGGLTTDPWQGAFPLSCQQLDRQPIHLGVNEHEITNHHAGMRSSAFKL